MARLDSLKESYNPHHARSGSEGMNVDLDVISARGFVLFGSCCGIGDPRILFVVRAGI